MSGGCSTWLVSMVHGRAEVQAVGDSGARSWRPPGFWLGRELRGLVAAFRFLTCLPIPGPHASSAGSLGRALTYFPVVGLAIGALLVTIDLALAPIVARPLLDFVLLATLVLTSGGLHLDGLIDTADALFGPGPAERRLEAMRRSGAGPRGVSAGLGLLVAEFALLTALPADGRAAALLLAPMLGRWAIVYGYFAFPYARKTSGLSLALKQGATAAANMSATVFVILAIALLAWPAGLVLLALAWLVATLAGQLAMRRLGGMSGDVYGATEQIVECVVLLAAPLLRRSFG